jgi:hypothetical protein
VLVAVVIEAKLTVVDEPLELVIVKWSLSDDQ